MNKLSTLRSGVLYLSESGTLRYVDERRAWKVLPGGLQPTSDVARLRPLSDLKASEKQMAPTHIE